MRGSVNWIKVLKIVVVAPMHRIVDLFVNGGFVYIVDDMGQHPLDIASVRLRPCVPISGAKGHHEVFIVSVVLLVRRDTL